MTRPLARVVPAHAGSHDHGGYDKVSGGVHGFPRARGRPQLSVLLGVVMYCALVGAAAAQTYPAKPVRIVVGFAAGGPADVMARLIGQRLSATLGQSFVVENRAGAGGTIGARAVAEADADGYTLLLGN